MSTLVTAIMTGRMQEARQAIHAHMDAIRERYCVQLSSMIGDQIGQQSDERLVESDVMHRGRITLIRRRIRKGKLQRNVRRSSVKGYTVKQGKVLRIPAAQRLRMRMRARRASIKRRAKLHQILRKRKISLRKRKALGIH